MGIFLGAKPVEWLFPHTYKHTESKPRSAGRTESVRERFLGDVDILLRPSPLSYSTIALAPVREWADTRDDRACSSPWLARTAHCSPLVRSATRRP